VGHGLFTLKGTAGRLGGGKKDLSMLFVYEGMRSYLRPSAVLGLSSRNLSSRPRGLQMGSAGSD